MKSLTLGEEFDNFCSEIKETNRSGFYFWNIHKNRREECETAFDFIKEAYDEDLQEILKDNLFGVEYAINKNGIYALIRFYDINGIIKNR